MQELTTRFLLSSQGVQTQNLGEAADHFVSMLDYKALWPCPWDSCLPVRVLIEDRDRRCHASRGARFHPDGLDEAFKVAETVVAVLYRRPLQVEPLGHWRASNEHTSAIDDILATSQFAVFIKTTNDRLTYWAHAARLLAPATCRFFYTDSDGVAAITSERRAAA
ncbi:MAG: hypothetical protein BGN83_18280 [Rhizobium sp. 63-7]|nr:MAG: hypothetical protein BGN83_18280 [Rhizobium sp. 63-7]